jgi:type IV secretion system protein TrbL
MSGCSGLQVINPLCQAGQLIGGAASAVATSAFDQVATEFGKVASAAVNWLWAQVSGATAINLSSPGIETVLVATGAIAALIAMMLFVIQVIVSALRREPGGLGRAVRGLGVAFIGSAFAISATGILLVAVDQLSSGVVEFAFHTNLQGLGRKLVVVSALPGGAPAGVLLISLVLLVAVVMVWGALMIRKLLILVSAVFAPLAFSGATADITRGWVRKWIELTVALIASKLILVIIFMLGISVLDGAGQAAGPSGGLGQSVTQLAIGILILLLGGLAPWAAIKLVHFTGEHFAAVGAHGAVAVAGAGQAIAAPKKAGAMAHRVAGQSRGGGQSSGAAQGNGAGATGKPGGGAPGGGGRPTSGAGGASAGAGGASAGAGGASAGAGGASGGAAGGAAGAAAAPVAVGAATVNAAKGAAARTAAGADEARSATNQVPQAPAQPGRKDPSRSNPPRSSTQPTGGNGASGGGAPRRSSAPPASSGGTGR